MKRRVAALTLMFTNMRHRLRPSTYSLACCLALLSACVEQTTEPVDPALEEDVRELSATIGPDGGELVGREGGSFEGVRLVIPPGALGEPTRIRITAVGSAVPMLSELAEGVGPGFAIEPAGLELAEPAELTLPVTPSALGLYLAHYEECKVWMRNGDDWRSVEQTTADDDSVTIRTETLDLALAGVQLSPKKIAFACEGVPGTTCLPLGCNTPGKFCLETLPVTSKQQLAAADQFLFIQGPGTGLARYDLDTGALVTTPPAGLECLGLPGETFAFDAGAATPVSDGSLWTGSCRHGFPGAQTGITIDDTVLTGFTMRGRVANGEGNVMTWVASDRMVLATQDATTNVVQLAELDKLASELQPGQFVDAGNRFVANPLDPSGAWMLTTSRVDDSGRTRALVQVDEGANVLRELEEDPEAPIGGFPFGIPTLLDARGDQLVVSTIDPPRVLVLSAEGNADDLGEALQQSLAVPVEGFVGEAFLRELQFDDEGGIWALKQQEGTPNKLLYYAPGATNAKVLQVDGQVLDIVRASAGRMVIKVLRSDSTQRDLLTLRKVQ